MYDLLSRTTEGTETLDEPCADRVCEVSLRHVLIARTVGPITVVELSNS